MVFFDARASRVSTATDLGPWSRIKEHTKLKRLMAVLNDTTLSSNFSAGRVSTAVDLEPWGGIKEHTQPRRVISVLNAMSYLSIPALAESRHVDLHSWLRDML